MGAVREPATTAITDEEAQRLRRRRIDEDLTFLQQAKLIGVSMKTLYRLETDPSRRRCKDRTADKIRRYLKRR